MQNSSDLTTRQRKRKLSHLGQIAHMEIANLLWTVAHLFTYFSENKLTSGDKDTIRRSREPTVNTTASGKAESTEEGRVYVNDLVVSVTMVLLEDSAAVVSLGLLGEELGCTCGWKRESLHR